MAVSISNLMLNFAPVTLSGQPSLTVGYRPYEKDTLHDLRAEFPQTHVLGMSPAAVEIRRRLG